ncbi:MAG: YeeE/YedE thiosulfate transporter family protein [Alphaproteobacteria bacterium]
MFKGVLPWYWGGVLLAAAFFAAVLLVKPIGVSTQFVIADAVVWDLFQPDIIVEDPAAKSGYASPNAYLNKSGGKYAANAAHPLNYSFIFVLAMMAGAFLSAMIKGDRPESAVQRQMPEVWRARFGDGPLKRYIWAFIAGFVVLFGARLAGGCTSGHMMSGMMQTALSGYLFSLGAFAAAIPLAIILFKRRA